MAHVRRVQVLREELPLGLDLGARYGRIDALGYVLVGLEDEHGQWGVGWTFSIDPVEARAIEVAARERGALLLGAGVEPSGERWERVRRSCQELARGVAAPCASALDLACWDLYGRQREQPVHRLLGAAERVALDTYASDALWSSLPDHELARNAAGFAAQGFRSLKIRTGGSRDPARERARVEAVRAALGGDVEILYDALQHYDTAGALALGRALEPCGIGWLEDPVPEHDLAGLAQLRDSLRIPIAAGEDATWPEAHDALLGRGCVDVLMVDPKWIGGITPWCALARRCAGRGVRMTSHISPELCAPLLAAFAPAGPLEWFSWSFGLYDEPPSVEAGCYALPQAPGFGLRYRADLLERLLD